MTRAYSSGFTMENNPVERLWPTLTAGDIGYMLSKLQEASAQYRVHYRTANPWDEDIDAAKRLCKQMKPLRADFGRAIDEWVDKIVEACWDIRYPVLAPKVLDAMYSVAVACASSEYTPQLALVQARYGTFDSSVSKLPGSK
jgi:hypothetical protein